MENMKTIWEMYREPIGNSLETASGLQMDGKWMRRMQNERGILWQP